MTNEINLNVPFFRVTLSDQEISAVADSLRSGWLTTGPKVQRFEEQFAAAVGARFGVAVNSCTAALHLALEAIGLRRGEVVLVPALTFAATAEVVRYFDALPVFVDCDDSLCMSPAALAATLEDLHGNRPVGPLKPPYGPVRAVIPMHYGGYVCDMEAIQAICREYNLDIIEDSAHSFPAAYRPHRRSTWRAAGTFGRVGCFSFYANKCITTGEGGMAVTDDPALAERMRLMSLHGMNRDAWRRFTAQGSWYYEIVAPGYKYNLTDMAAALGLAQLPRADEFRARRESVAERYNRAFAQSPALEIPPQDNATRRHAWHLYPLRLNLNALTINRDRFIDELKAMGIICSVHYLPLHLNPYYRQTYGWGDGMFPVAERQWPRLISLPIFPAMTDEEVDWVIQTVVRLAEKYRK